ncbi:DUF2759 domain-containing protein [Bacillus sp. 2205SS5-2]|uniref:DUF2759 domain-containing protein n=1 Tax=Bacillus sp. 2205SS5-2 TaxID=3109031 RepID=UPI003006D309
MGFAIITALVTVLALFSSISALKNKNLLGIVFGIGTLGVFGWFTIATLYFQAFPAVAH